MSVVKKMSKTENYMEAPANDEVGFSEAAHGSANVLPMITPFNIHNKVLIRKRKKSKHPLRELRIQAGFTLEDLAETTQLSPSYLSRLESGSRRLNADIMHRLAIALNCNPGELLPYHASFQSAGRADGEVIPTNGYTQDLPVFALEGTPEISGSIKLDTPEQWVARPIELVGVSGAMSCVVRNGNFGPKYSNGERLLLHPSAPLVSNCSVLAVTNDNRAFVGKFINWETDSNAATPNKFVIEVAYGKENEPAKCETMSFDKETLRGTYRIIGTFEAA